MTNLQLILAICIPTCIPTVTVLIGILLNNQRFNTIESRLIVIEADLRRFYEILGDHSGRIDILQKKVGL